MNTTNGGDPRETRLAAIMRRYPMPQTPAGVTITTTQDLADIWWLLDQVALCERTIARLSHQLTQERAKVDAARNFMSGL
jgi:hypothetical protein